MQFQYLSYWPWTLRVKCWARLFFIKFDLRQLNRTTIIAFFHADTSCHAVTLIFDLELLRHFDCHVFKLCTKPERNRIIDGWVIDDLARLRRAILGVGHFCPTVLRGTWTQLHQTWPGHRAIIPAQEVCFRVRISCCIFERKKLKVEWCWERRKISHFLTPPPCEQSGEVGRSLYQLLKLYLRPNLRNTFDGHPLRGW